MTDKTPREEWFDFLENYMREGRPEDRLAYDNKEFLQKIKLYFDNRSVVCDGKIDLSYVYFRIKEVIDEFIDKDFRREIGHIRSDIAVLKDKTNKEIFDVKKQIDKTNDSLTKKIETLGASTRVDITHLKKTLEAEIENVVTQFTDDINGVKDYFNDLCAGIEETHKNDIDALKSQMETFANLTSQAVENAIAKAKEELEAEIEEVKNEIQSGIDGTYDELKEKIEKNAEDISAINSSIGQPNGIASLDENGQVPTEQLPTWTDDVIEVFAEYDVDENGDLINIELFTNYRKTDEITEGEEGKLYVDVTSDDLTYIFRWTGREWVCVNNFVTPADIASLKKEITNIQGDVTSIQGDIKDLFTQSATKDELNSAVEDLEKKIDEVVETTGGEDERISALEESVEALESDVKTNTDAIEELKESKQDKLTAGEGIDITDNVISSTVDTTLYEVVANLPTSDIDINKIYVVPVREKSHNKCTEYIYVDGRWEILGNKTNLDDYYTVEQIDEIIETINANVEKNTENIAENTSSIEKNTTNIESNTTKISQIEDALAELGVEVGDDESKLSALEKQVTENTAAIETKQDKLTAGTGIAINEINGETVIECTLDTSLYIFCTVLPTTDIDPNKIYVTPSNDPGEDNVYIEWLYVDGAWEKIGELHSDMDMSDYYTKSEVDAKVNTLETSIEGVSNDLANTKSELESSIESTKSELQSSIDANASNIETNASAIADLQESKQNKLVAGTNIELEDNVDGTTTVSCIIDTSCYKIVASLPEKPDDADVDKIFMVPSDDQESQNEFVEYIWVDTAWEQVGTNSYTKAQVDAIASGLQESIDTLTSTVESNNTSTTESIEKLESSLETLESSLEFTKSDLQAAIDTNAANIETNTANIEANKESIETNTSAIEDLKTQISNLEGAETSDIESLKEAVETNTSAIETNKSAIEANKEAIEANASSIENLESSKQDKLTAGTGISITEIEGENVIACTLDTTIYEVVLTLPTENIDSNKIYVVPNLEGTEGNECKEYLYIDGEWEEIGTFKADTDLSDYYTKTEVDSLVADLQADIDANAEDINEVSGDLSDLETRVSDAESSIDNLESTTEDLQEQINANKSDIAVNASDITSLTEAVDQLEETKQDVLTAGTGIAINEINGETVIECTLDTTLYEVVSTLPDIADADPNKIYVVPVMESGDNKCVEWLAVDGAWEKIGEFKADTDLSDYYTKEETNELLNTITEAFDEANAELEESLKELQDEVKEDESKMETIETSVEQNTYNITNLSTRMVDVESGVSDNASDIEELKNEISSDETDLSDIHDTLNDLEGRVSTNETNIETNTNDIAGLQESKQDKLTAGTGISITEIEGENVIACTIDHTLYKIVPSLPTQPDDEDKNKIFLVAEHSEAEGDIYVEYIWVESSTSEGQWEKIGEFKADTDLSSYATIEYVDSKVSDLQSQIDTNTADIATNKDAIATNASSISALEIKHQSDIDSLNALVSDLTGVEHADFENVQNLISNVSEQVTTNTNDISDLSENKQDKLTAGTDITIDTINGETVIAWTEEDRLVNVETGVEDNATAIAGLQESKQDKLTAGDGISIDTINGETVIASTSGDTLADLQSQIDSIDSDLATAEDAIENNTSAIETLQNDVASNATAIEELQGDVENLESSKQDALTAGDGIEINTINGETVIASTYGDTIKDLQENKQDKLTAGNCITISDDNVIACTLDGEVFVVEGALPENPSEENVNKIYVVPSEEGTEGNYFTEYIWIGTSYVEGAWEKIGEFKADVDLSNYATTEYVNEQVDELDSKITANTSAIETNTTSISANASAISSLESQVSTNTSSIETLQSDVETNAADIASNKEAIEALESKEGADLSELKEAVETNASNIATNTSAIEGLQSDVEGLQSDVENLQENKQDKLTAGEMLSIYELNGVTYVDWNDDTKNRLEGDENVITANTNAIETNTSSIEELQESKQDKLVAGTGIEITSDNTINVTLDTALYKVVGALPSSPDEGDENKIWIIPNDEAVPGDNQFIEYIWVDGAWEKLGEFKADVDLSDYATIEYVDSKVTSLENTIESVKNDLETEINDVKSDIESTLSGDYETKEDHKTDIDEINDKLTKIQEQIDAIVEVLNTII